MWEAALAGCRRLAEGRRRAAERRNSVGGAGRGMPGYLTLELREFRPPLMIFIKAVSIPVPPEEASVVVFFQVTFGVVEKGASWMQGGCGVWGSG